jgi:hypothetical protein
VTDRVRLFARHNDFRIIEERADELVFKRGGGLGDLFSFDVHNVSTRFVVSLERRARRNAGHGHHEGRVTVCEGVGDA